MKPIFCFNRLLNIFISKAMVAVNKRSPNPFMFYLCPVGYLEDDRKCIFIFIGA